MFFWTIWFAKNSKVKKFGLSQWLDFTEEKSVSDFLSSSGYIIFAFLIEEAVFVTKNIVAPGNI